MRTLNLRFDCPACAHAIEATAAVAGREGRCPYCGATMAYPTMPRLIPRQPSPGSHAASSAASPIAPAAATSQESPPIDTRAQLQPLSSSWRAVAAGIVLIHVGDILLAIGISARAIQLGLFRVLDEVNTTLPLPRALDPAALLSFSGVATIGLLTSLAISIAGTLILVLGPLPRRGTRAAAGALAMRFLMGFLLFAAWRALMKEEDGPRQSALFLPLAWLAAIILTLGVIAVIGERLGSESLTRRARGFWGLALPAALAMIALAFFDPMTIGENSGLPREASKILVFALASILAILWLLIWLAFFFVLDQAILGIRARLRRQQSNQA